jgi:hypothetical protein
MFLKVFFPTKEEKLALKTWIKASFSTISSYFKKCALSVSKIIFDITLLSIFAVFLGALAHIVFPLFTWSFGHKASHMLSSYLTQKEYLDLIKLYFFLGFGLLFPLLFVYIVIKFGFKIIKFIIYLSVNTVKSSTQLYEERKEAMLPVLEKDMFESKMKNVPETPKKKVKL